MKQLNTNEAIKLKIGFIGFGEVASTLSVALLKNGAYVSTCVHDRSRRTNETAEKSMINICESYRELAEESDILISTVVPSHAVEVAGTVGEDVQGIYVDMNNVSPKTVKTALQLIKSGSTVDAAIIGSVRNEGLNVNILASGPSADNFAVLRKYGMNIHVIGKEPGQASTIKLLRSIYTKGVSALLFESLYHAYKIGLDEDVLAYLSKTEENNFKEASVSRIISAAFHADRRAHEMEEVVGMLQEYQDPVMSKATEEFFKILNNRISKPKHRPESYKDVFELISE